VPQHRGLGGDWADLVVKVDQRGRRRVVRMVYEVCTFQALREALRCKEIWVVGADTFRNPDEDLPQDFEARRVEHYGALHGTFQLDLDSRIDYNHGSTSTAQDVGTAPG
jgi:hypothetical protein